MRPEKRAKHDRYYSNRGDFNRFYPKRKNGQGADLFAKNPGGAPANVLAMAARLGGKTAFIGKVGRDTFGNFLRSVLVQNGIGSSGLAEDEAVPTTLAFVQPDENGDRSFTFYRNPGADRMLTAQEVKMELRHIIRFANAAGALTTTGSGAIPAMPDMEQIRHGQSKEVQ